MSEQWSVTNDCCRFAIQGIGEGVWEWDCRRDVAILSPQFLALLGDRPEDASQTSWQEFFTRVHPDDVAPLQAALQQHLEQRVPYKVEGRVQHRDGHTSGFASGGRPSGMTRDNRCEWWEQSRMLAIANTSNKNSSRL